MGHGTMETLRDVVRENRGVLTVRAGEVRDAYGAERLGRVVCQKISCEFNSLGLVHRPREFPGSQDHQVRVFIEDSPAGWLILAAEGLGPQADRRIRTAVSR